MKTEVPAHERDVGLLENVSQAISKASHALQVETNISDRLACRIDTELSSMAGPVQVRFGSGVCTCVHHTICDTHVIISALLNLATGSLKN